MLLGYFQAQVRLVILFGLYRKEQYPATGLRRLGALLNVEGRTSLEKKRSKRRRRKKMEDKYIGCVQKERYRKSLNQISYVHLFFLVGLFEDFLFFHPLFIRISLSHFMHGFFPPFHLSSTPTSTYFFSIFTYLYTFLPQPVQQITKAEEWSRCLPVSRIRLTQTEPITSRSIDSSMKNRHMSSPQKNELSALTKKKKIYFF